MVFCNWSITVEIPGKILQFGDTGSCFHHKAGLKNIEGT